MWCTSATVTRSVVGRATGRTVEESLRETVFRRNVGPRLARAPEGLAGTSRRPPAPARPSTPRRGEIGEERFTILPFTTVHGNGPGKRRRVMLHVRNSPLPTKSSTKTETVRRA